MTDGCQNFIVDFQAADDIRCIGYFGRAAIHIAETVNVVLAANAFLYFMHNAYVIGKVGHAVNATDSDIDAFACVQSQALTIQNYGQNTLGHCPEFTAVIVGLQGQGLPLINGNVFLAKLFAFRVDTDIGNNIATPAAREIAIAFFVTNHICGTAHLCACIEHVLHTLPC